LTSITVPDSVNMIRNHAFYNCSNVETLTLSANVVRIEHYAFCFDNKITEVALPVSLLAVGQSAFYCTGLTKVWYEGSSSNKSDIAITSTVHAENGTHNNYLLDATWKYNSCFKNTSTTSRPHVYTATCDEHCDNCNKETRSVTRNHSLSAWIIDTEATCVTAGSQHKECKNCQTLLSTQTIAPTGIHTYDNDYDTTCNVCGDVRVVNHNYEWVVDTEPTCGTAGSKHEECTTCGAIRNENTVIEPTGEHVYDNACDIDCNVCDDLRDVNDHNYEWVVDLEPTCGVSGIKHQECTICGDKQNTNTAIAPTEKHIYDNDCDIDCNVCDDLRDVNDHNYEWVIDLEPAPGVEGKKHEECTICGDTRNENTVIEALKVTTLTISGNDTVNESETVVLTVTLSGCENGTSYGIAVTNSDKLELVDAVMGRTDGLSRFDLTTKKGTFAPANGLSDLNGTVVTLTFKGVEASATAQEVSVQLIVRNETTEIFNGTQTKNITVNTVCTEHSGEWVIDVAPNKTTAGHKYRVCTVCGETEEKVLPITLKFNTRTLSLSSNIQVNYKVRKTQLDASEYKNPYAVFEFDSKIGPVVVTVTEPRYELLNGTEYYVFDFSNLAPDQMGNNIAVKLYAEYDGEVYLCDEFATYSVKDYCDTQLTKLANATSAKDKTTRTLMVDILNYGAALQVYNNYNTNALVNSHLTATQKAWGSTTYAAFEKITAKTGADTAAFKWNSTSLLLSDAVNPTADFTAPTLDGLKIVVTCAGRTTTYENIEVDGEILQATATANRYKLVIKTLGAHEMREPITFDAYINGEHVQTLTTSVASYANGKAAGTALGDLVIAMMKYGDSVAAYRG